MRQIRSWRNHYCCSKVYHIQTLGGPGSTCFSARLHFKGDDCFEKATSFIAERWCDSPELAKIKAGFAPFGTGKGLGQKN